MKFWNLSLFFALSSMMSESAVARLYADGNDKPKVEDADVIVLESFDKPMHTWKEQNDPVMGGKSTGTFTIEDGVGKFVGQVVNVPFLQSPGFIKTTANKSTFPDITNCQAIQVVAKSMVDYDGYRISFGTAHAPGGKFFANGYKANLPNTFVNNEKVDGDDFGSVTIPLTDFTDFWDDATGDAIHTCEDNSLYCPDAKTLQNLQTISIWGEGIAGDVHLEVQTIQAVGCASKATSADYDGLKEEPALA